MNKPNISRLLVLGLVLNCLLLTSCTQNSDADSNPSKDTSGSTDSSDSETDTLRDTATPTVLQPGERLLEETVSHPEEISVFTFDNQIIITLPPGTVDTSNSGGAKATLILEGGPLFDEKNEDRPWKVLQSYEIKLIVDGKAVQPLHPLQIAFRIFPEQLRSDLEPEDQLIAARLDDEVEGWTELPTEFITDDDNGNWLVATTYNLSSFASFIINYPYVVLSVPPWRFFFLEDVNAVGLGAHDIFELVVNYREILDNAVIQYEHWGFKSPWHEENHRSAVSVYVLPDSSGAQYNPLTGSVTLSTVIADDAEARHEAAHEIFHMMQNTQLNYLSMDSRRWFVEAAAEYAADRANGGNTGQLGKGLTTNYFRKPYTELDEVHEYATAALITRIVNTDVTQFKSLHDAVFGASSITGDPAEAFATSALQILKGRGQCSSCTQFSDALIEFAEFLILNPNNIWTPKKSAFTEWAEATVTHTSTSKVSSMNTATSPKSVKIAAARIEDAIVGGNTHPVYLWYPGGSDCVFSAWHVPQDDVEKAVKLTVADRDEGKAFTEVNAAPGDIMLVLSTTPSECETMVELRTVPFCHPSEPLSEGSTTFQKCEDIDGIHESEPSFCDGSQATYRYMACSVEGACLQTRFSDDCATDAYTPVCKVDGVPPRPVCTFAP